MALFQKEPAPSSPTPSIDRGKYRYLDDPCSGNNSAASRSMWVGREALQRIIPVGKYFCAN